MESFVEKVTAFFKGGDGDGIFKKSRAKALNYLVIIGAAGVLLIILANVFTPAKYVPPVEMQGENTVTEGKPVGERGRLDMSGAEEMLNRRLEEALANIDGVGAVKASVNLASTTEMDYAVNTTTSNRKTDEKDTRGGNRTITEVNENGQLVLLRESENSKEAPVVIKEIKPEVRGVMVVAEGAGEPGVKADLIYAIQVYLDVPVHKVVVLPSKGR